MALSPPDWVPHRYETMPWSQQYRSGTYEDRTLCEVTVALPPDISRATVELPSSVTTATEQAVREIVALDHDHGAELGSLGLILLRTESVASSKIEQIDASMEDYARALHGVRANPSATAMAAATDALAALVSTVDDGRPLQLRAILRAHRALMDEDPTERFDAGRLREVQNWIGGSDHSPRNALYVPPPPTTVRAYMNDLIEFSNRDDVPVLAQAAIAHAQFESIHPFTDGNGRIGRALVNTILRRRGVTTRVVVPLASALVAHRDRYFDLLDEYRAGRVEPIISMFSRASTIAAVESRLTAGRLVRFSEMWQDQVGRVRRDSATHRLLERLVQTPVFTADDAIDLVGGSSSSVYAAIDRLATAGVVRALTERKRNQVWGVVAILDELDDLGVRIGRRARASSTA